MRQDADSHAEEDKKKREIAEARNQADSMCFQLEKLIKEHDEKLADADKDAVNKAIEKTREAAKSDDVGRIKSAIDELEQASHALSKNLYEAATPPPDDAATAAGPADDESPAESGGGDDDAIDAEFEVKDS